VSGRPSVNGDCVEFGGFGVGLGGGVGVVGPVGEWGVCSFGGGFFLGVAGFLGRVEQINHTQNQKKNKKKTKYNKNQSFPDVEKMKALFTGQSSPYSLLTFKHLSKIITWLPLLVRPPFSLRRPGACFSFIIRERGW